MRKIISYIIILVGVLTQLAASDLTSYELHSFGEGGQNKMMYDRRQRPGAVYLDGKVFIAFNAGSDAKAKRRAPTQPMVVSYDLDSRSFSDPVIRLVSGLPTRAALSFSFF